jgi:thioredoxin 1
MSRVQHVTVEDFEAEVLRSPQPVLVDFYATWCPPCKLIAPMLEQLAEEFAGRAKIVKVNVDDAFALAERFQIRGVPTWILFRDGQFVDRMVGALPPQLLRARLARVARRPDRQAVGPAGSR